MAAMRAEVEATLKRQLLAGRISGDGGEGGGGGEERRARALQAALTPEEIEQVGFWFGCGRSGCLLPCQGARHQSSAFEG
jgi:hypothetical protein